MWFRVRPAAADPGDDLMLEAAVATASPVVVTLNPRDMPAGPAGRADRAAFGAVLDKVPAAPPAPGDER